MENINSMSIQDRMFITNELIESRDLSDLRALKAKSLNIEESELSQIKELSNFTFHDNPIDSEPYPIDEMINHLKDLKEKGSTHVGIEFNTIWNNSGEPEKDVYTLAGHKFRKSTHDEIYDFLTSKNKQRKDYLKIMLKKMKTDLARYENELDELNDLEKHINAKK